MNLTYNALCLCLLTTPTFTFLHQNLNFNRARISYSFDHFIFGQNIKYQKCLISQSTFSHFLSTPVTILKNHAFLDENQAEYMNQYITNPLYFSQCCDYKFISNIFYNCVSHGDHNQGGAIYINCENQNNVQITNNCFLNCEADQGGSFYIKCKSAMIQENSFKGCEAVYYSILYMFTKEDSFIAQNHFSFSKKDESTRGNAISFETKKSLTAKYLNISSNKLNSAHAIFSSSIPDSTTPKYIYLNLYNNTSKYVFESFSSFSSIIENANFIKNQGFQSLIKIQIQIRCQSCSFISDESRYLTSAYALFVLCTFDDYESNIRFTYHSNSNCKFNVDKTIDIKINSEQVCMTKSKDEDDSKNSNENKKVFLKSFIPIFFIVLIVITVLVIIYGAKHGWFQRKTDTIPLMYV